MTRSLYDRSWRNPNGGKAHLPIKAADGTWVTACGRATNGMTETLPAALVEPEDQCPRCFPPGAATNYPTDTCAKCGYLVSLRPELEKVRRREVRGDGGWDHVDGACPQPRYASRSQRRQHEGMADRKHRDSVAAARRRGDVL